MAKAGNSLSKTFVWILMGLLFVGLAGFGATNLSGTIRTIGSVGDKPITTGDYVRALQNELTAVERQTGQRITVQQAVAAGLDQQVVAQLITTRAFDHEAAEMGLSVGDRTVADELRQVPAFNGPDGDFDREAYRFALSNANLDEAEFEAQIREDTSRTLLQGAILAGNTMPETFGTTLANYIGEERRFEWAALTEAGLGAPLPAPTDDDLAAHYDANIAQYTRPEAKRITYAWLTPAMVLDEVPVDTAALRAEYDRRSAEFNQPERRLVERLVFADDDAAAAAQARLQAGEVEFEALVTERGLALGDIDLGDVTRSDLGAAAAEPVFAAEVGDVVGPAASDLGPALFRVNGILAAQETPFEEAEPLLRDEMAQDAAVRAIDARFEDIENLLAGGATLEDVEAETGMQLGQIDYYAGVEEGPAAYAAFQNAAAAVTTDDFPEVAALEDGGIFALRLDETLEAAPRPFVEVADQVADDWRAAALTGALTAEAEAFAERLRAGETMADLGLAPRQEDGVNRGGFIDAAVPGLVAAVFSMENGDIRVVAGDDAVAIVHLQETFAPTLTSEEMGALMNTLNEQAQAELSRDIFQAFANDIRARAGISLDQSAINAVHSQF